MYLNLYEFFGKENILKIFKKDLIDANIFKISIVSEIEPYDIDLLNHSNELVKTLSEHFEGEIESELNPNFFPNVKNDLFEDDDEDMDFDEDGDEEVLRVSGAIVQENILYKNDIPICDVVTISLTNELPNLQVH